MPRKTKPTALADQAAQPQFHIPAELLDQLVTGPMTPGQVQGLFDQFKKSILERALGAEMSHHLGYAPGQAKPTGGSAIGHDAQRPCTQRHGQYRPHTD